MGARVEPVTVRFAPRTTARTSFSPCGKRWPEGSDEGSETLETAEISGIIPWRAEARAPHTRPAGIFSRDEGKRGAPRLVRIAESDLEALSAQTDTHPPERAPDGRGSSPGRTRGAFEPVVAGPRPRPIPLFLRFSASPSSRPRETPRLTSTSHPAAPPPLPCRRGCRRRRSERSDFPAPRRSRDPASPRRRPRSASV